MEVMKNGKKTPDGAAALQAEIRIRDLRNENQNRFSRNPGVCWTAFFIVTVEDVSNLATYR
jgi:hypothetical protein